MSRSQKRPLLGSKSPRLAKHNRLLSRFYEPLVLLRTLGQTRGQHSSLSSSSGTETSARRQFLNDIAFICDYERGGDTVTAVAVQHLPEHAVFWLAANTNHAVKVSNFVESIITQLRKVLPDTEVERSQVEALATECIDFNKKRIRKYQSLLRKNIERCTKMLELDPNHKGSQLSPWLKLLLEMKLPEAELCRQLYVLRHSPEMISIAQQWPDRSSPFRQVRHYVGRIGVYIRVAERLTELAPVLCTAFLSFKVRWLETPPPQLPPQPDAKLALSSVAGRMIPSHEQEQLKRCRERLDVLNQKFDLEDRFVDAFCDHSFRPRVHAELAVLEHFHGNDFSFFASDRFIGCSKPACYCCALYINNHPGNFETPASHHKIYINWLAPDPVGKTLETAPNHQRDMLNCIVKKIRQDALDQVFGRSQPYPYQPDSTTGISAETRLELSSSASSISDTILEDQNDPPMLQGDTATIEDDAQATSLIPEYSPSCGSSGSDGGVAI